MRRRIAAGEAAEIAERMHSRGARISLLDGRRGQSGPIGPRLKRGTRPIIHGAMPLVDWRDWAVVAATLAAERQLMKTLALLIFDELAPFLANLE